METNRKIFKKIFILTVFIFCFFSVTAQTMYVKEQTGTLTAFAVNDIRKLAFSSGGMNILKNGGATSVFAFSKVRYINFSSIVTNKLQIISHDLNVSAYPNPAINVLNLNFSGCENGTIEIRTIGGKLVYAENIIRNKNEYMLNVVSLSKGFYLCTIHNNLVTKTITFIKQ